MQRGATTCALTTRYHQQRLIYSTKTDDLLWHLTIYILCRKMMQATPWILIYGLSRRRYHTTHLLRWLGFRPLYFTKVCRHWHCPPSQPNLKASSKPPSHNTKSSHHLGILEKCGILEPSQPPSHPSWLRSKWHQQPSGSNQGEGCPPPGTGAQEAGQPLAQGRAQPGDHLARNPQLHGKTHGEKCGIINIMLNNVKSY